VLPKHMQVVEVKICKCQHLKTSRGSLGWAQDLRGNPVGRLESASSVGISSNLLARNVPPLGIEVLSSVELVCLFFFRMRTRACSCMLMHDAF